MVFWILAGLALYLMNVFGAGSFLMLRVGPTAYMEPRDSLPEPGKFHARALKSAKNFSESLPVFVVLGLLALIVDGVDLELAEQGAMLFVLARLAYIAAYVAGVPYIRSVIFTAGFVGLGMMAYAVI
ncbi:MAPEG family protein [Roseovarius rhodophyticola]|uniref:MAPEG family protein n=1 Tax=Roseovarius rhodophyticola TaxID=3080827 RepID=A0ABZ2TB79_9RHOB|nr:MAPEG family protein [Roseovarius sp. W115]MDV2930652.1 MAPEG family protein [Roseovarius sp. W115]